jgi:hypothetical protein
MKPSLPGRVDISGIKNAVINFLIPLICLGISGALGLLVIYPSFISIKPLQEEIKTQQALKESLDTKVSRLKDLQSYRSVVKENSELINRVFVSESSAPLFLDEINQLARNASFEVTRLATSSSEADVAAPTPAPAAAASSAPVNSIKSLTAALGAKSSYSELIIFMKDMEVASRILDIKDFRYNFRADAEGEGGTVDVSVSGPYMQVESTAVTDEPIDLDVKSRSFTDLIAMLKKLKQYDFSGGFEAPAEEPKSNESATETTPPAVQGVKTQVKPAVIPVENNEE